MTNACATRGSIACNRIGFGKYLKPDFKGLSGKMKGLNITSTEGEFKKVLDKIYKGNEDKIIKVENPTSEEQVQEVFGGKKGTFIMIAKKDVNFTGHITIYNGKKVIGGNSHMYLKDAQAVYLYVADKNNKQSK
nr:type VI secretion system amidase effector protein Tae4 [Chryseobacterium sp. 2VB]